MEPIRLRPHHSICFNLFRGKGYSKKFVEHLKQILSLPEDTVLEIADGLDSVCASCPNRIFGRCLSQKKVEKMDADASLACGFHPGETMTLSEFKKRGLDSVIGTEKFDTVCSSCSFYEFCSEIRKENQ